MERKMQSNFPSNFFPKNQGSLFFLQAVRWTFYPNAETLDNSHTTAIVNFFPPSEKISPLPQTPMIESWLNLQTPSDEKYQKIACPTSRSTFPVAVTQAIRLTQLRLKRRKGDKSLNFPK